MDDAPSSTSKVTQSIIVGLVLLFGICIGLFLSVQNVYSSIQPMLHAKPVPTVDIHNQYISAYTPYHESDAFGESFCISSVAGEVLPPFVRPPQ